jgi:hypothetical protein
MFDYTPGSGQEVTGLHLSASREAGPLTHTRSVVVHKNPFLLHVNKIIRIHLVIFGLVSIFLLCCQFGLTWVQITEVPVCFNICTWIHYRVHKFTVHRETYESSNNIEIFLNQH